MIGETLYHAPIAIVRHWGLFDTDKSPGELDLSLMPMLFSIMDTFQQALASFEASLADEDDNVDGGCAGSVGYQTHIEAFCEVAKVDIDKTNESNYKDIITSTLSLITVVFEDFGTVIELHGNAKDINTIHQTSPIMLLNSGFKFEQDQHMCKADNNAIKQIRFLRWIYTLDWHGGSPEYENADGRLLFLVHTANGKKYSAHHYLKYVAWEFH